MATDIGLIWNLALDHYKDAAGFDKDFDINTLSRAKSVRDVISISDGSLKKFENFRHDGGGCDKFRTFVADHLEPVEKVAEYVADAASGAFPPTTAIFKVIDYFIKIATEVRADYEKVKEFFEKLGSYLKSLKILEGHVPEIDELREALMKVMSCLLVICGISTKFIKDDRWKKGVKKFLHLDSDELKDAYADLEKSLAEEARAVNLAQLRIGQEIKVDVRQGRKEQQETHVAVLQGLKMDREILGIVQRVDKKLNEQSETNDLDNIKGAWKSIIFDTPEYDKIESTFLEGTGKWLLKEGAYQRWAQGDTCFLWLSGPPGTGKSYLTYSIAQRLGNESTSLSKTAAAIFYFDNAKEKTRSVKVALCNLIVKLAEKDAVYCKRVSAQINKIAVNINEASIETVWSKYVRDLLQMASPSKMYLIMDGLDKTNRDEWTTLLRLLSDIPRYKLPVQVLLSGRPELDFPLRSICDPQKDMIQVTERKNHEDLKVFVRDRYEQTMQLKHIARDGQKVIKTLLQNAGGMFLYVDLVLKELDSMSQWPAILGALECLPQGLTDLYAQSLAGVAGKASSPDEVSFLRTLFQWITYAECPLSLYEYHCLQSLGIICKDYSVENEVQGRCASLLRLSGHGAVQVGDSAALSTPSNASEVLSMQKTSDTASPDDDWENDDDSSQGEQDDTSDGGEYSRLSSIFVQAVHHSLIDYLRDPATAQTSFMTKSADANADLFMACKDVICNSDDDFESPEWEAKTDLAGYAVNSLFRHLENIDVDAISDHLLARVTQGLKEVFSNAEQVATSLERQIHHGYFGLEPPLKPDWPLQSVILNLLAKASQLKDGKLQPDCSQWVEKIWKKPSELFLPLAKKHVENWLNDFSDDSAAFRCALAALSTTNSIQALSKPISDYIAPTKEEIMFVASAFPDIPIDADAHRMIALTLARSPRVDPQDAIVELNQSLKAATTKLEQYRALVALAEIQNRLLQYSQARDSVKSALSTIYEGNIYPSMEIQADLESMDILQAYLVLAEALSGSKEVEDAIAAFHKASELAKDKDDLEQQHEILGEILDLAGANKRYSIVMREIENADPKVLSVWFGLPSVGIKDDHAIVQEAARRIKREDSLIRCYNNAITLREPDGTGWIIRYHLANFYRRVLGDNDKTHQELKAILAELSTDPEQEDRGLIFQPFASMMCEILCDKIKAARDPTCKKTLKEELEGFIEWIDTGDRRFKWMDTEDHCFSEMIYLVLVKPYVEAKLPNKAKKILQRNLQFCKDALSNSIGDDDSEAFMLLAKVLALAGMRPEAEIALSCTFSAMRPEFLRSESEDDPLEAAIKATRGRSQYEEDLADVCIVCAGKDNRWHCWVKPMYLCVDCIDVCLCEGCHGVRLMRNALDGGDSSSMGWMLFCGKDHEYIQGPVKGWGGMKDGVMRIGEQKIKFEDWLKNVEATFRKVKLA